MTADIIDALLWRARASLRVDGWPLFAGHGLADPLYRPPRLPYASVLGPLSYAVEPERDLPREHTLTVRTPGYLAGTSLPAAALVPPPGVMELLLDGEVAVPVAVDHGADTGQPLTSARGQALGGRLQASFDDAVAGGMATVGGIALADAERLSEIARTTLRWDDDNRRVVIASGRRGPVIEPVLDPDDISGVALAQPTPHALALGLGEGALAPRGRLVRHRVPAPLAMAFDMRIDLWAGSQRHLASLLEAWARVTPTRCQLLLRPALLAADVPDGTHELPLQRGGESPTRWTVLQLEPPGAFADRRSGRVVQRTGGAVTSDAGLELPAGGEATITLLPRPAVPDPLVPAHPSPAGWALALRLQVTPGAAEGDTLVLADLSHGAISALRVSLRWETIIVNGGPPQLQAVLRASGQAADATVLQTAVLRRPAADLERGVEVHALVDATAGQVAVFADGEAGVGPATGPGPPAGGEEMLLRLGQQAGPVACTLGHVQVLARPLGPLDHRHRAATATADRWRPGDPVMLVRSSDGFSPRGTAFAAVVSRVDDGVLHLDRPVSGTWPRHDTMVASRLVFSQQTQVRRRDDLAANLTRLTLEHTVSGFVDPDGAATGAPLVEALDLHVSDRVRALTDPLAPEPATGRVTATSPGVHTELVPARALSSTVVTKPQDADAQVPPSAEGGAPVPD